MSKYIYLAKGGVTRQRSEIKLRIFFLFCWKWSKFFSNSQQNCFGVAKYFDFLKGKNGFVVLTIAKDEPKGARKKSNQ